MLRTIEQVNGATKEITMTLDQFKTDAVDYGAFTVNKTGEHLDAYFAGRGKADAFYEYCQGDSGDGFWTYSRPDVWTVRITF